MFPVGFSLAVDATRRQATSALPNAPVVDDVDDTTPASTRVRVSLATALRGMAVRANRAAERVEPLYLRRGCEQPLAIREN